MKTRTDKELKDFARLASMYSLIYAMGKKYGDPTLMDGSLKRLTSISKLFNSEGYYVKKVGTDRFDSLDVTYSTYEVKRSEL